MKKSEQIRLGTTVKQAYFHIMEERGHRRAALCALFALCFLFAGATVRLMTLRGLSLENIPNCGLEEHKHTDECMAPVLVCEETERPARYTLSCGVSAHHHGGSCYDDKGQLICGKSEQLIHSHNQYCYNESNELICRLSELTEHTHNDNCYELKRRMVCGREETPAHAHGDECYETVPAELVCGREESEGHVHGGSCYVEGEYSLVCGREENPGHAHTDDCFAYVRSELTCGRSESGGHSHSSDCREKILACGMEEGEEHQHDGDCYETILVCGKSEGEGAHSHSDQCYSYQRECRCGKSEGEGAHTHSSSCFEQGPDRLVCEIAEGEGAHAHTEDCYTPEHTVLTCGMAETEGHHHSESCYESDIQLVCRKIEYHEHTESCYPNEDTRKAPICGMLELPEHQHTTDCLKMTDKGHAHSADCYEETRVCGMAAHIHNASCYLPGEDEDVDFVPDEPKRQPEEQQPEEQQVEEQQPENPEEDTSFIPEDDGEGEEEQGETEEDAYRVEDGMLTFGMAPASLLTEEEEADDEFDDIEAYFICGLEEHLHDEDCYDENGELICEIEEHSHIFACLSQEAIDLFWGEEAGTFDAGAITDADKANAQDAGPYLDTISFTPANDVHDEQKVQFDMTFEFPAGYVTTDKPVVVYRLPDNVVIPEGGLSGPIRQANEVVGDYEITGHYVYMKFNDDYLEKTQGVIRPDVQFRATVDIDDDKESDEIYFPGKGGGTSLTVKGNGTYNDITMEKTAGEIAEDGSITYTVTVGTTKGTGDGLIIEDELSNWNTNASFDQNSVVITKNGQQLNNGGDYNVSYPWNQKMSITGLAGLNPGESLTITYKVNDATLSSGQQQGSVNNTVKAKSDKVPQVSKSTQTALSDNSASVNKSGQQVGDQIKWTVTINTNGQDLNGYTVSDTMIPDGTEVKIQDNITWQQQTVTMPYTFPSTGDQNITYTLEYYTPIPDDIGPYGQANVSNEVKVQKDNEGPTASANIWVQGVPPTISKTGALNGNEIEWTITVNRNGADLKSDATIIDSIDGQPIPDGTKYQLNGNEYSFPINFNDLPVQDTYVFTYKTTAPEAEAGETVTVNNRATLEDDGHQMPVDTGVQIIGPGIEKTGYYNAADGKIYWEIRVHRGNANFANATLDDENVPEGTEAKVWINADGAERVVTFPVDLSKLPAQEDYTFRFATDAPALQPGDKETVPNRAVFRYKDVDYPADATVEIERREDELDKVINHYIDDEHQNDETDPYVRPLWEITGVPADGPLTEYELTDEMFDPDEMPGAHFATPADIFYNLMISVNIPGQGDRYVFNTPWPGDATNYIDVETKFYDENGSIVASSIEELRQLISSAPDTMIKKFSIRITPKDDQESFQLDRVYVKYMSRCMTAGMTSESSYKNTATAGAKEDSAYYGKRPITPGEELTGRELTKLIRNQNWQWVNEEPIQFKLPDDHKLHYRVVVDFADGENGDIVVVDTLPEGTRYVPGSLTTGFLDADSSITGNMFSDPSISLDASADYDENTRKLTITFKSGYNPTGAVPNWLCAEYDVEVYDWPNPFATQYPFTNGVEWEDAKLSNSVTATLETEWPGGRAEKNGEMLYDEENNPLDQIEYTVIINEKGADVNPDGDRLVMTDELNIRKGEDDSVNLTHVSASLMTQYVRLYEYDPTAEDGKGTEISSARYRLNYDDSTRTLTLEVPDELACLLVYRYEIDRGGVLGEFVVENSVDFGAKHGTSNKTYFAERYSSASVSNNKLTLNKVDEDNNAVALAGATFKLERWKITDESASSNGEGAWLPLGLDGLSGNSSAGTYTTDSNGQITLDVNGENSGRLANELIRITEVTPPDGYTWTEDQMENGHPVSYYAYITNTKKSFDAVLAEKNYLIRKAIIKALGLSDGVSDEAIKQRVLYVDKAINLMIPNKNTRVEVKKLWLDYENHAIANPPDVQVQLMSGEPEWEPHTDVHIYWKNSWDGNYKDIPIENAKIGSTGTIYISGKGSIKLTTGGVEQTYALPDWNNPISAFVTVTEGMTITLDCMEQGDNMFNTVSASFVRASSVLGSVTAVQGISDGIVTLNASNNWTYSWKDLPVGNYYSVQELNVPAKYAVTYDNNDGITSGLIVVTNKDTTPPNEQHPIAALPETGGSGTTIYTIAGGALMAIAAVILILLKKRHPDE